jgi:hypothetical protein
VLTRPPKTETQREHQEKTLNKASKQAKQNNSNKPNSKAKNNKQLKRT